MFFELEKHEADERATVRVGQQFRGTLAWRHRLGRRRHSVEDSVGNVEGGVVALEDGAGLVET